MRCRPFCRMGVELKCNMKLGRDFTIAEPAPAKATKPSSSASACRRAASCRCPAPRPKASTTASSFCGPSTRASRCPSAAASWSSAAATSPTTSRAPPAPGRGVSRAEALEEMGRGEQVAYDVARSALRMSGDKEVHVVCLEDRDRNARRRHRSARRRRRRHPPAQPPRPERGPRTRTASSKGLRTVHCTSVFNAEGRFNPKFDEAAIEDIAADIDPVRHRPDLRPLFPRSLRRRPIRARPHQGQSRDLPDDRSRRLRLRRHRARPAPLHRRHRLGPHRRPFDARFSARHPHRCGAAQALDARRVHDVRGLARDCARDNPPVLETDAPRRLDRDVEERYPEKPKPAARRRAACAATSTPSSTPRSASPATAVWMSAPRT